MSQTALIIGGTGFVGAHLRQALAPAWTAVATGRGTDVRDPAALADLVSRTRPDAVINLAAVTTVRETLEDPRAAYDIAYGGLANLIEALAANRFAGRLLQVGSSEVYGYPAPEALPLSEDSPLAPMSPYAFAKVMAEKLALASQDRGFEVVVARPFTHIGPGQSARFAVARFASEIASGAPVLTVGSLAATRDFTDVRDVARAYVAMLARGRPGAVYNVCSGVETPLREVVEALVALSGRSINIAADPSLTRGVEADRLRGDATRLSSDTGWAPQIALSRTLADVLEDARNRAGSQG